MAKQKGQFCQDKEKGSMFRGSPDNSQERETVPCGTITTDASFICQNLQNIHDQDEPSVKYES